MDVTIEDDVFIAPFFCAANTLKIKHGRDFDLKISNFYLNIYDPKYII